MKIYKVCVDPGHGGSDPGTVGLNGELEKETNLRVALLVEQELRSLGIEVLMTRRDDRTVRLSERCQMANSWGADIFLSLHADAAAGPSAKGHHAICSIHSKPGQGGYRLARLLVDALVQATGRKPCPRGDAGVWSRESEKHPGKDYYAVIRDTNMPAVILERGFLTNPEEAILLFDCDFLARQAQGIARAVAAYFGLSVSPQQSPRREVDSMFKDMVGHWAKNDVEEAAKLGLVSGRGDGTFGPDEGMTRAQGTVVTLRAYKKLEARIAALEKRLSQLEGRVLIQ